MPGKSGSMGRSIVLGLALLALALPGGCALYRNDRCWVPDDQYAYARELFIATGSLELVERQLADLEWRRCRRNEVVYRLQKEFEVLPEELPAPSAPSRPGPTARPPGGRWRPVRPNLTHV